ncbi:hypothetical protein Acr_07g0017350 [Actinidia rufa]|uniref:Uncharacterized protein n=1 Tax=Actinidia rufa TaxID=165716 RepID=A0A7J0F029_9ERIC|nr:hypothetical protein Acr_07g0017350 [Actinidia rufa]
MLTSQPKPTTAKSALSAARPTAAIAGRSGIHGLGTRVHRVCVRAVISGGDKKKTVVETSKELNGSAVESGGWVDVRAVITIRKKMKERMIDKIEDQWEYVVNGMGQGICLHLISDQIDPDRRMPRCARYLDTRQIAAERLCLAAISSIRVNFTVKLFSAHIIPSDLRRPLLFDRVLAQELSPSSLNSDNSAAVLP